MGDLVNIISPIHMATKRDCVARMNDEKVHCMQVAQEYGFDYWDGDRRYGYGGYKFIQGYWKPVAEQLINRYELTNLSSVLDVGCGKAFLLYELIMLLPGLTVVGFDCSEYGITCARPEIRDDLFIHRAEERYPYQDSHFDLVISLGCLHNLRLPDVEKALHEIQRVGKSNYVMVESYRDNKELFNLQCWALTAQSFFDPKEWAWLYNRFGYKGDYEFIFFE